MCIEWDGEKECLKEEEGEGVFIEKVMLKLSV
jgi:hypothetical protein